MRQKSGRAETERRTLADVEERLEEIVDRVAVNETRVVIERDGEMVAALVSPADLARLARFDEERAEREALLARLAEPFKDIPPEQLEAEVAEVVAEVRAEMEAGYAQIVAER